MALFRVATDSGCDLTDEVCREKSIYAIPMKYTIDDTTYYDTMNEADAWAFYAKMRDGALPKTSSVNPEDYIAFWDKLFAESDLPVVQLCMGSGISATYQNGVIAYERFSEAHPDAKIYLVDTLGASASYGVLAVVAAQMRDEGKSPEEVADWCRENAIRTNAFYTTGDLHWLYLGGRVSRTGAAIAHALNIWPLMSLDEEGKLYVREKIRGKKQVYARMVQIVKESVEDAEHQTVRVCHADNLPDAQEMAEALKRECSFADATVSYIGSTIGTHTGPGLITLFFLGKPRPPRKG